MKDKRQKLAFAWPGYPGDPFSYFSYMYAVAASGYPSGSLPNQSNNNSILPPNNPLTSVAAAAAAARLAPTKIRPISTTQILNGSTDTVTSCSSASSPTSSSSSPKQHSPMKPTINFALPAMGLASFLPNAVNDSATTTTST